MRVTIFASLPHEAKAIREAVFMQEQGFQNEFDEMDQKAVHMVLFDEETPVATCRLFKNEETGIYTMGRLAVMKAYRGKNVGSIMMKEAEKYVRKKGGTTIVLHAQCRVIDFYKKSGFIAFGKIEDDEGCPHTWMKKEL